MNMLCFIYENNYNYFLYDPKALSLGTPRQGAVFEFLIKEDSLSGMQSPLRPQCRVILYIIQWFIKTNRRGR